MREAELAEKAHQAFMEEIQRMMDPTDEELRNAGRRTLMAIMKTSRDERALVSAASKAIEAGAVKDERAADLSKLGDAGIKQIRAEAERVLQQSGQREAN